MEFHAERLVKSPIKVKQCYWCGEACDKGQPRYSFAGRGRENDFYTAIMHAECRDAMKRYYANDEDEEGLWPEEGECKRGMTPREQREEFFES